MRTHGHAYQTHVRAPARGPQRRRHRICDGPRGAPSYPFLGGWGCRASETARRFPRSCVHRTRASAVFTCQPLLRMMFSLGTLPSGGARGAPRSTPVSVQRCSPPQPPGPCSPGAAARSRRVTEKSPSGSVLERKEQSLLYPRLRGGCTGHARGDLSRCPWGAFRPGHSAEHTPEQTGREGAGPRSLCFTHCRV